MNKKAQTELTSVIGLQINYLSKQGYNPQQVKHIIIANMLEEAMDLALDKDNQTYDYYALKPLFVAINSILKQELAKKSVDAYIPQVAQDMQKVSEITHYLDTRIERMTETK